MTTIYQTSGGGHGSASASFRRSCEVAPVLSSPRISVNSTHGEEMSPGNAPIGTAGGEHRDEEQVTQFAMNGQDEDASDGQSQEESSHSMKKSEEYAQLHTSRGPSYHINPLRGESKGLASGVDLSKTVAI
eukprot:3481366-Pyramimonas_sp.AAC.1